MHRTIQRGLTLLETLIVVSILGLLIALIVPAIMKSRSAATTLACKANLKNFGLALSTYMDAHGMSVPRAYSADGGVWVKLIPYLTDEQVLENPTVATLHNGRDYLYPNPDFTVRFRKYFRCPASGILNSELPSYWVHWKDGSEGFIPHEGRCNYAINNGFDVVHFDAQGAFSLYGVPVSDMTAGLSKIAFVSEVVTLRAGEYTRADPAGILATFESTSPTAKAFANECMARSLSGPNYVYSSLGNSWIRFEPPDWQYSHSLPPNSLSCMMQNVHLGNYWSIISAGSEHDGLVNVLMGDGSVTTASETIDASVWRRMGNRYGHDVFQ
jgi:prepilin-type N-terminal cleavage/methylation domain-containing protein/prepilin-type processing-associated H-X9-DG protein